MIAPGNTLPDLPLVVATPDGPRPDTVQALLGTGRVVLFGVPGAFTPTCSARHLPGFVDNLPAFAAKGVDRIVCMAVNDAFVLRAWAKEQGVSGEITMLSDGSALLTRALGLELDITARNMGVRCQRFAMVVQDGTVTHLAIEPPGEFGVSGADSVLASL